MNYYYIMSGEVIGFRLFRATGLAFAIRPKDGVARQGRRGGFHKLLVITCLQFVRQRNTSHDIQPMGGVRASLLDSAGRTSTSAAAHTAKAQVFMVGRDIIACVMACRLRTLLWIF